MQKRYCWRRKNSKAVPQPQQNPANLLESWSKIDPDNCRKSTNLEVESYWVREADCDRWNIICASQFIEYQWRTVLANVFINCAQKGWPVFINCIAGQCQAEIKLIGDFVGASAASQRKNSLAEALLAAYIAALNTEKILINEISLNPEFATSEQIAPSGDTQWRIPQAKVCQLVEPSGNSA